MKTIKTIAYLCIIVAFLAGVFYIANFKQKEIYRHFHGNFPVCSVGGYDIC